jgi:hypothetical protein
MSDFIWCLLAPIVDDTKAKGDAMPSLGNGYLGTIIGTDTIFSKSSLSYHSSSSFRFLLGLIALVVFCLSVGGVYNGNSSIDPSHRARVPSPLNIRIAADTGGSSSPSGAALDIQVFMPLIHWDSISAALSLR